MIDSEPKRFTVDLLREIKQLHERDGNIEISKNDAAMAAKLLEDYRVIYIEYGSAVHVRKADTIHAKR